MEQLVANVKLSFSLLDIKLNHLFALTGARNKLLLLYALLKYKIVTGKVSTIFWSLDFDFNK